MGVTAEPATSGMSWSCEGVCGSSWPAARDMRLRAGVPALRNELRWAWRRLAFSWRSSLRGTLGAVSNGFETREEQKALYGRLLRSRSDAVAGSRHGGGGGVVVVGGRVAGALFVNTSRCGRSGGQSRVGVALAAPQCCATVHRHTAPIKMPSGLSWRACSKAAPVKLKMTGLDDSLLPSRLRMLIATTPSRHPQPRTRSASSSAFAVTPRSRRSPPISPCALTN
jgi:hypothetical protein